MSKKRTTPAPEEAAEISVVPKTTVAKKDAGNTPLIPPPSIVNIFLLILFLPSVIRRLVCRLQINLLFRCFGVDTTLWAT